MKPREYLQMYEISSLDHAENIMKHGPMAPFGVPDPLPEQLMRIDYIVSHADGLVLDVGCDSGYILHEAGGRVGVDIASRRIEAAKYWFTELDLSQALAESLPFKDGIFDTVIMADLLEHVLNPEEVLDEAHRVLRIEGGLILTVPDEIYGKSHESPEHLRVFTEGQLRNLLTQCFEIDEFESIYEEYAFYCISARRSEPLW